MKQLKDGGCAFYHDRAHSFKLMAKKIVPSLLVGFVLIFLFPPAGMDRYSYFRYCLLFWGIIVALAFGTVVLCIKFAKPSCTIYDQYITWKDSQEGALRIKERKLFFKDLQGFFTKKELISLGKHSLKEKVIYFVMKDSQINTSFYPYFTWMSEQDQNLFIALLTNKGLIPFPEDYKPN